MRLTFSLPCLLVVLTVISVVVALPALDSVTSSVSSLVPRRPQDESQHADPHAHLLARRSEIYELEKRQQVNCTNRYALFFTECWDILNIHDYLVAPGTGWINTVRHCQNTGGNTWDNDGSNCCVDGEPWSTCYLRLAIPGSNHDCTSASTGRCGDSMIDDINVAPAIYPYVRYTVKNIYAINNFFVTYYGALYNAAGIVGNNVETMIQVVDVIVKPSMLLQNILLSLAVGLAFLGAPSFAVQYLLKVPGTYLKASVQAFVIGSQQAPNVGRAMWPTGTDNSQLVQTADLHLQLSNITSQMSAMMDNGVRLLMTDISTFVNYAGQHGRYSGPNVTNNGEGTGLTVPQATDTLAYALKTYLLSYSMWQNKWYSTFDLGPYTTKEEVQQTKYCTFDDANGVCVPNYEYADSVLFWSPWTYRVYSLFRKGPKEALKPYEMIKTINSYGWAPLDVLFDGGFNCTAEGKAGSSVVNFNFDGSLDLACVSQLPMYIQCGSMCPTALANGTCLFGDLTLIDDKACQSFNEMWNSEFTNP